MLIERTTICPRSSGTRHAVFFDEVKPMAVTPRIEVAESDGARVVRFKDRMVFDERTVREVGEQIGASLPNDGNPLRVVLDFSGVDLISSSLLGKLILLQRRIDSTGGRLRLCELSPTVQAVFRTSNLDRLFAIDRDCAAALGSVS